MTKLNMINKNNEQIPILEDANLSIINSKNGTKSNGNDSNYSASHHSITYIIEDDQTNNNKITVKKSYNNEHL